MAGSSFPVGNQTRNGSCQSSATLARSRTSVAWPLSEREALCSFRAATCTRVSFSILWTLALAALAFREDRVFVAARQRGLEIDPTAMERPGDAARFFRVLAEGANEGPEFGGKLLALGGEFDEERLVVGGLHIFCSVAETLLA